MPLEHGKQPEQMDATGEFKTEPEGPAGDATGEYRDEEPVKSGDDTEATGYFDEAAQPRPDLTLDYNASTPQVPAAVSGAATEALTGEYVNPPTEALTGEYRPDGAGADQTAGDATGEFVPEEARGAPTQSKRAGQTADKAEGATGAAYSVGSQSSERVSTLRRAGNLTSGGTLPASPDAPLQSGRYAFKNLAGKGGMGEVWLAEDVTIGRPVAVKRMLKARRDLEERFLHEAQVTGQLEHPGIIPVHEVGKDERGQAYYVMKFVQGRTLQQVIADYHAEAKPGDEAKEVQQLRLLNIFLTLCQTVAYAHSRGVIHRDLKPDNVMIGTYGESLLLDWGLAKIVGAPEKDSPEQHVQLSGTEASHATMMGSAKGTPTYFSPEAAAGLVNEVDQVSDVYLLGGILYHILTGRPPRQATKIKELIEMARNKPPEPPHKIKKDVPRALEAICVKALAHQKKDRYQTAAALAEDTQRYLAGEPVSAYRETFWERAWRWAKKHRTAIARAAIALVIVGVVGTSYALIRDAELRRQEDVRLADEKRQAAEAKSALDQQRADLKDAQDKARREITSFRLLADRARYLASLADQVTDQAPVLDVTRALDKGREALRVAEPWGDTVAKLPLEDQQPQMRQELYNLLLEMAQLSTRRPGAEPTREALALLADAEKLHTKTRSYHRLRAHCLRVLDLEDKGAIDAKKAADPALETLALDHYLLAEELRRESMRPEKSNRPARAKDSRRFLPPVQETLKAAIAEYNAALDKDQKHYWSHYQLGSCLLGLGRSGEAAQKFGACIALNSDAPWGFASRALALGGLGQFKAAHDDLDKALDLDREFVHAKLYRGMVFAQDKKYDEALTVLTEVLTLPVEKRLVEAAFSRAQVHLYRHDYEKALADLDLLDEAKLNIRNAHLDRARIFLSRKQGDEVLESLSGYLTGVKVVASKDPVLLEKRARELRILANELRPEAAAEREFTYRLILDQLDEAYAAGGRTATLFGEKGAMEELLAALAAQKTSSARTIMSFIANYFYNAELVNHIKGGLAAYSTGIDIDPKDVKLRNKRGWVYVMVSMKDAARDDFLSATRLQPDNAEAHTGLGYAFALLKQTDDAQRHGNLALLAMLQSSGDYIVVHNVACIFAVLAKNERSKHYEDLAVDLVLRAVSMWEAGGMTEPNEIRLIRDESAFDELRKRPEIEELLKKEKNEKKIIAPP